MPYQLLATAPAAPTLKRRERPREQLARTGDEAGRLQVDDAVLKQQESWKIAKRNERERERVEMRARLQRSAPAPAQEQELQRPPAALSFVSSPALELQGRGGALSLLARMLKPFPLSSAV